MYPNLLALHSLVRWLVLTSLLFAIFRAYYGWLSRKQFSSFDNAVRHWTATIAHIQLFLGIWLYFISPIVAYFLHHFSTAIHERAIRFFWHGTHHHDAHWNNPDHDRFFQGQTENNRWGKI